MSLLYIKWQKINLGFHDLFALLVFAGMLQFLVMFYRYIQRLDHRTTFKNISFISMERKSPVLSKLYKS